MSQFETSEIMTKYAAIIVEQDGFIKEAWTWRDIVTELGIGAALDVGMVAGVAGLAGAAGGGGAAGAAAGIGAATGPIGWAVLAGAALTMGIWYLTRQMDDNLTDLIDRLEDLDPNENAKAVVQGWIKTLEQFKPIMKIPPTTTDPKERAIINGQKVMGMKQLYDYLLQIQRDWPQIKPNLTDIVFDIGQAEHAINETTLAIGKAFVQAQQYASQQVQIEKKKVIKQIEKKEQGVAGKGKSKERSKNTLNIVKGLQTVLNKIIYAKFGGAGVIREDGIYGQTTADALVGVVSSDWNISKAIAQNAKVNYNTMRDIEYMRSRPNLIRMIYKVLSDISKDEYAIPLTGGTGDRRTQKITRETIQMKPDRPLSRRELTPQ